MRTRLTAFATAVALAGLAGCGTDLAPQVHPGAAAVVGDTTISLEEVDELALELCQLQVASLQQAGQAEPLAFYRALAVENLARYEVARQYAEEHDLEPVGQLEEQLGMLEQQMVQANVPPEDREVILDFERRQLYRDAVLAATGDSPQVAMDDFEGFAERLDTTLDPRFGSVDLRTGEYAAPDGLAVRLEEVDRAQAGDLPSSQRCG